MRAEIIDNGFLSQNVIASYLLDSPEGFVLIESGPESTFQNISAGLERLGTGASEIRHVFVTHIHLDHSGGAWRFAELGAKVYVHPLGAPHLAEPERLASSAERVFGDRMKTLWGRVRPVPKDKIKVMEDGETVSLGGVKIRAFDTPGHAGHHHCYQAGGELFTGDAAGMRIGGGAVIPPTPPPEINIELWRQTIEKIGEISPDSLCPTHFGRYGDVSAHLDDLSEALEDFSSFVAERLDGGISEDEVAADFQSRLEKRIISNKNGAKFAEAYANTDTVGMNAKGLIRHWKKFSGQS